MVVLCRHTGLYHKTNTAYKMWTPKQQRRSSGHPQDFIHACKCTKVTDPLLPAVCKELGHILQYTGCTLYQQKGSSNAEPPPLLPFDVLPPSMSWNTQNIEGLQCIDHDICSQVSSAMAMLLQSVTAAIRIKQAPLPGLYACWKVPRTVFSESMKPQAAQNIRIPPTVNSAASIELSLVLKQALCSFRKKQKGSITISCNGAEALQKLDICYPPSVHSKHFNLVVTTQQMTLHSPIEQQFHHVKGHQDKINSFETLDTWAQLKMVMDARAKEALHLIFLEGCTPIQHQDLAYSLWHIAINGEVLLTDSMGKAEIVSIMTSPIPTGPDTNILPPLHTATC